MIFTLTKTTCSQRGELFAKSDFHDVLMPRFYTCETANPAISHVPYTWHAVRCILSAHCVPQRVFLQQISKKS